MQRNNSTHITFLLVFYSIIAILIEYGVLYYFNSTVILLAVSSLVVLLGSHGLLRRTKNYEVNFTYTLLLVFLSTVITILLKLNTEQSFIPVNINLYLVIGINWFFPCIYSIVRCLLDHNERIDNFNAYYRNTNILFVLFYISCIAYLNFLKYIGPLASIESIWSYNFIPFMTMATYIEQYIYNAKTFSNILFYLFTHLVLWIPFGFYMALLLRRHGRLTKVLPLLLVPLILEGAQYLLKVGITDIDDFIFSVLGGFLGQVAYYILNSIFLSVKDDEFLEEPRRVMFAPRNLYF